MSRTLSPDEALRAVDLAVFASAEGDWEPPVPFGTGAALPEFPVVVLPDWGAAMVSGVAEEAQVPEDLPGVVYLGVLAAAAGGRAEVEVQPGWREPVNLYAAPVMPPGSRKSAVFREMVRPVLQAEAALQARARADITEQQVARSVAQEAARRAIADAAKLGTDMAMAEAVSAARLADEVHVPTWPRLVADDATAEALTSLLAQQGGKIAMLSAEGDLFDIMAGRYSSNGQTPNLGVFLKGHAGDLLLVDRKGREPERISRPALTIVACIQPRVLIDIARKPVLRGRGLLARVLYCLPPDIVGYRRTQVTSVDDQTREVYTRNCEALALSLAEWSDDPAVLPITTGARTSLSQFQEEIEPRLRSGIGDLDPLRDWASKVVGAAVRLAGLLHLAEHFADGWVRPIEIATMDRAIALASYFTEHARVAFDQMGADPVIDDARFILAWLARRGTYEFSKRELHMAVYRGRFPKATDLDPPLALLEQHGYIRPKPEPERTGAGRRPSPRYSVHPSVTTEPT